MVTYLAVKTEHGYYKEAEPYLMVDLSRATVFTPDQAADVLRVMSSLKDMGTGSRLVEMTISLKEWQDIPEWLSSRA